MAHADGVSQAVRGECAREAMEHALRAWISAVDLDYPITRNITQLGNIIIASQVEGPHPVARERAGSWLSSAIPMTSLGQIF